MGSITRVKEKVEREQDDGSGAAAAASRGLILKISEKYDPLKVTDQLACPPPQSLPLMTTFLFFNFN